MKRAISNSMLLATLGAILLPLLGATAYAQVNATMDDGREVILKNDGSWTFANDDRFATSTDGTRVRLKADGSWEFIGNAPKASPEQVMTESLEVSLIRTETEVYKQRATKNVRFDSQTVFYLNVDVSRYSEPVAAKLAHFNLFKVTDSKNNSYPVISVTPQPKQLAPGEAIELAVRVDGSPAGAFAISIRNLYLEIDKNVFNTDQPIQITQAVEEIKKVRQQTPFVQ